jgi:hypothetical protein
VIVSKLISGGQTGVDVGALRAARSQGVPTGGTMARGYMTLVGPKPEWAREFDLVECMRAGYAARTRENVANADVTVRMAAYFNSPGERCTASACRDCGVVPVDVHVERVRDERSRDGRSRDGRDGTLVIVTPMVDVVSALVAVARLRGRPIVVNAAGNSERTAPGIEALAERAWAVLLNALKAR